MVGRDAELRLVRALVEGRAGSGLVVSGDAGVGKTRIAREATRIAGELDRPVHWVSAIDAIGVSDRTLEERYPALLEALGHVGAPARVPLVIVDDVHLLDPVLAGQIHQALAMSSILLLATARASVTMSAPVLDLWSSSLCRRLDLEPLSRASGERLIHVALGARLGSAAFARVWALALGNPLYLREIVLGGLTSGSLRRHEGRWRWKGDLLPSQRLTEIVEQLLVELTPAQRAALETIAAAQGGGVEDLAQAGIGLEVLEGLERLGVVTVSTSGRRLGVVVRDPVVGWVVRAGMRELASRRVARDLAQVTSSRPTRRSGDHVRLAWLLLRSGQQLPADLALAGAREAVDRLDFSLAETLARQGELAGGGVLARLLLVESLIGQGHLEEAEEVCAVTPAGTDMITATLTILRSINLWWGLKRREAATRLLHDLGRHSSDPVRLSIIMAIRSRMLMDQGHLAASERMAERVLDSGVSRQASTMVRAGLLLARSARGVNLGEAEMARICPPEALPRMESGRWVIRIAREEIAAAMGAAHLISGRLSEARQIGELGLDRATMERRPFLMAVWVGYMGLLASVEGRLTSARALLLDAVDRLRATGPVGLHHQLMLRLMYRTLATVCAQLDDRVGTAEAVTAMEEAGIDIPIVDMWVPHSDIWTHAMAGREDEAVQCALAQAKELREMGATVLEALVLLAVVRMGRSADVVDRLEELAPQCDLPMVATVAALARAITDEKPDRVEALALALRHVGTILVAAEAMGEASRLYREAGDNAGAHRARARCDEWVLQCEGARTPILRALRDDTSLTHRQSEIARMAAAGMSSRAIADRLVISVRTVDNTLGQIYRKLGVRRRRDLARAFSGAVAAAQEPADDSALVAGVTDRGYLLPSVTQPHTTEEDAAAAASSGVGLNTSMRWNISSPLSHR